MYFKVGFLSLALCVGLAWATIDADLLQSLQPGIKRDVLIDFAGGNSRVIQSIESRSFRSRESKVKALTKGLQGLTQSSQGPLQEFLGTMGVQSQTFWSSNQMVVKGADLSLLQRVDAFTQVSRIQMLPRVQLSPIPSSITPTATTVQWGVSMIQADQVWDTYGTKVRVTHEALRDNFRSENGWFDPIANTTEPNDQNGHGTHTMGTIAGGGLKGKGIGVAPGAKWIACKGCANSGCNGDALLACGQFMLQALPDVVSNSPSIPGERLEFFMPFAIGNNGPICFSGGSPGDQPNVFAVGSTDSKDRSSSFSSRGPSLAGFITKPDIAAQEVTYIPRGDSGVKLPQSKVESLIETTAVTKGLSIGAVNLVIPCSFGFLGRLSYPNNYFGHGRINALQAVNATLQASS
ncbi:Bacillopeptidase F [Orchesella cincta]|uniref:Bacillopeptidase F n=1 Tax=Orchesella cincta TaxID=48709 RepID=A0A1D2NHX0_ORCCI|nr:Bacillopeptidase F [Orchesella cincta]